MSVRDFTTGDLLVLQPTSSDDSRTNAYHGEESNPGGEESNPGGAENPGGDDAPNPGGAGTLLAFIGLSINDSSNRATRGAEGSKGQDIHRSTWGGMREVG